MEVVASGGVLFDAAAVFGEDSEFDGDVLRLLFQGGDFGFEGFLVHVEELVFGVLRKFRGFLFSAEIAGYWVSIYSG